MSATAKHCGITIETDCSQFALGFLLIRQKKKHSTKPLKRADEQRLQCTPKVIPTLPSP